MLFNSCQQNLGLLQGYATKHITQTLQAKSTHPQTGTKGMGDQNSQMQLQLHTIMSYLPVQPSWWHQTNRRGSTRGSRSGPTSQFTQGNHRKATSQTEVMMQLQKAKRSLFVEKHMTCKKPGVTLQYWAASLYRSSQCACQGSSSVSLKLHTKVYPSSWHVLMHLKKSLPLIKSDAFALFRVTEAYGV